MPKAYHANIALRVILVGCFLLLGLGAAFGAVGIGTKAPGFVAFLGILAVLLIGSAVSGLWLNRIVLDGDRVKLARVGIFPFSILPHGEVDLKKVRRWGVGQGADPSYGGVGGALVGMAMTPVVLMFEIDRANASTYVRCIALGTYPKCSAVEIYEHIHDRCGRPVHLETSFFWGTYFPKREREWA
jgi:hypothetical protein